MLRKYGDIQKTNMHINDFVDDVSQFLIILKFGVMDYYNLPSFAENSINLLIAN
jgi:hypothetical protein